MLEDYHAREAIRNAMTPEQKRQAHPGNCAYVAFFVVAAILAASSIVWVPLVAGIIYRALR